MLGERKVNISPASGLYVRSAMLISREERENSVKSAGE